MINQNIKPDPVLAYALHLKLMQLMFATRITMTERIRMCNKKKELYADMRAYISTFNGKVEPYKYLREELERQRIRWDLDSVQPTPAETNQSKPHAFSMLVQMSNAAKAKVRVA